MSHVKPSQSPSSSRWRFTLFQLCTLMALIAAMVSAVLSYRQSTAISTENRSLQMENQALATELNELKLTTQFRKLERDLEIPNAAIFRRYLPWGEINRMRWESLEEHGVEVFAPYYNVVQNGRQPRGVASALYYPYLKDFPEGKQWELNLDKQQNQGSFIEGYYINHTRVAVNGVLRAWQHDEAFRKYLEQNPKLIAQRLRPLLLRLALAPDPFWRYDACQVLLEMGDRSEPLLRVLRESLTLPEQVPSHRNERGSWTRYYSYDPKQAAELVEQYEIEALQAELKQWRERERAKQED